MRNLTTLFTSGQRHSSDLLDQFIETQEAVAALPELSHIDKVKLEHEISIDHLYYSSKIEGTTLDEDRLNSAIHAA